MNIKTMRDASVEKLLLSTGAEIVGLYSANGWLHVFVTRELGLLHMSISHPKRYPTWDELKELRYALLPGDKTFAILFPPLNQYVNQHPNCFHLHEVPEMHENL